MKIAIDINQPLQNQGIQSRTNVYVWKNLDHLKAFYADIVDPLQIDRIAAQLLTGNHRPDHTTFRRRKDSTNVLNESCLCNAVEISLLDSEEVLNAFLDRPVEFAHN